MYICLIIFQYGGFRKAIRVGELLFNQMKEIFFGLCVLSFGFFATQKVSAQEPTFLKGNQLAGVGIGIFGGNYFGSGYSGTPYFTGYYENCFKDKLFDEKSSLGIGGTLGYMSNKWEYQGHGWKYTYFLIGTRGSLHYAFVDKLDTYAGMMLGYRIVSDKEIGIPVGSPYNYNGLTSDWYIGGRYYFTNTFAVFLELGYSWFSNGIIGISIKF